MLSIVSFKVHKKKKDFREAPPLGQILYYTSTVLYSMGTDTAEAFRNWEGKERGRVFKVHDRDRERGWEREWE